MVAGIGKILDALAALKGLEKLVRTAAAGVTLWYIGNADETTSKEIADAAAFGARCKTQADRKKALDQWKAALTRPRYTKP